MDGFIKAIDTVSKDFKTFLYVEDAEAFAQAHFKETNHPVLIQRITIQDLRIIGEEHPSHDDYLKLDL